MDGIRAKSISINARDSKPLTLKLSDSLRLKGFESKPLQVKTLERKLWSQMVVKRPAKCCSFEERFPERISFRSQKSRNGKVFGKFVRVWKVFAKFMGLLVN